MSWSDAKYAAKSRQISDDDIRELARLSADSKDPITEIVCLIALFGATNLATEVLALYGQEDVLVATRIAERYGARQECARVYNLSHSCDAVHA